MNSSSKPELIFSASSDEFLPATKEYENIWNTDGDRIVASLEKVSGLSFKEASIKIVVFEGISYAGHYGEPIQLRASPSLEVKKEVLIHELGHKMQFGLPLTKNIDLHRALFLFLYDVWVDLYGVDFANQSVAVEKSRKGRYDYESAWNWALSYSREERAKMLSDLRAGKIADQ